MRCKGSLGPPTGACQGPAGGTGRAGHTYHCQPGSAGRWGAVPGPSGPGSSHCARWGHSRLPSPGFPSPQRAPAATPPAGRQKRSGCPAGFWEFRADRRWAFCFAGPDEAVSWGTLYQLPTSCASRTGGRLLGPASGAPAQPAPPLWSEGFRGRKKRISTKVSLLLLLLRHHTPKTAPGDHLQRSAPHHDLQGSGTPDASCSLPSSRISPHLLLWGPAPCHF